MGKGEPAAKEIPKTVEDDGRWRFRVTTHFARMLPLAAGNISPTHCKQVKVFTDLVVDEQPSIRWVSGRQVMVLFRMVKLLDKVRITYQFARCARG